MSMSFKEMEANVSNLVPGESMLQKKGSRPYEQPAKTSSPMEGVQLVFDSIFNNPSAMSKLKKTIKGGVPKEVIANSISTMLHGEGIVSPQAIPLMAPSIDVILENFAAMNEITFTPLEVIDPSVEPDWEEVERMLKEDTNEFVEEVEESIEEQESVGGQEQQMVQGATASPAPVGGMMQKPEGVMG